MEVDFMTKTEMEKEFKRRKQTEQTFIIWAFGLILIILLFLIIGERSISLQQLAVMAFMLMIFGWLIGSLHQILKKRELRRYDTGSLAMIDTEP